MINEAKMYEIFEGKYIVYDGEYYIPASYAIAFLEHVFKQGASVIAIDGYVMQGTTLMPNSGSMVDCAHVPNGATLEAFKHLIENNMDIMSHFDFTLR